MTGVWMAAIMLSGCGNGGVMTSMAAEKESTDKSNTDEASAALFLITEADPEEYICLPDISSLTVTVVPPQDITEENIEEQLANYETSLWELRDVEGRDTAEEGDIVNIDYEVTVSGRRMEELDEQGCNVVTGTGTSGDGYENGIMGMHIGEIKEISFTYPEDYYNSAFAGQDAVFSVRLNRIQYYYKPGLTDDAVKEMHLIMEDGTSVESVAGLREYIREDLTKTVTENYKCSCQGEALDTLCRNTIAIKPYSEELKEAALNCILREAGINREELNEKDIVAMEGYVNDYITERMCVRLLSKGQRTEDEDSIQKEDINEEPGNEIEHTSSFEEGSNLDKPYEKERTEAADYILAHAKVVELQR